MSTTTTTYMIPLYILIGIIGCLGGYMTVMICMSRSRNSSSRRGEIQPSSPLKQRQEARSKTSSSSTTTLLSRTKSSTTITTSTTTRELTAPKIPLNIYNSNASSIDINPPTTITTANNTETIDRTLEGGEGIAVPAFLSKILAIDFKLGSVLTEGGAAVVYTGTAINADLMSRSSSSSSTIIIKCIKVPSQGVRIDSAFTQELSLMWFLRGSRYICKLIGFCFQPPMILMRYYQYGSLSRYIRDYKRISGSTSGSSRRYRKRQAHSFTLDIARGLMYMHQRGIVHLDIKTGNILLDRADDEEDDDRSIIAVITDFGLAQILDPQKIVVCGFQVSKLRGHSLVYAAPEIILRNSTISTNQVVTSGEYNSREYTGADVYSLGMIIWELLHRKTPYKK